MWCGFVTSAVLFPVFLLQKYQETCLTGAKKFDPNLKFKANTLAKATASILEFGRPITSGKQAMALKGIGKGIGQEIDDWLASGSFPKEAEYKEKIAEGTDEKVVKAREKEAAASGAFDFV